MEHTKALLLKGVTTLVVLFLILGIGYGVSFLTVLLLTLVVGAVSYPGDLFILPRILNLPAAIADFVLAFLLLWGAGSFLVDPGVPLAAASAIAAAVLAVCEYYFHLYLATHVLPSNNRLMMDTQ
ncbi:DUF2512 family protein [Salibacterium aidingense]|uniref:DUF2512 family protein n=1 Tax=Salibacterium aidingense TaxID=384933 RepID=UPI0004236F4D|nr:DUF2512 family protein [Salibacterium aidingense]